MNAGDEIEIKHLYNPEFNAALTVRPDGKANLPLVGDVPMAGRSVPTLVRELTAAYSGETKGHISINVRTFAAQRIFVGGQVAQPGVFPLVGRMSVLQAITAAAGVKDDASLSNVLVIRREDETHASILSLNVEQAIAGDDLTTDLVLKASDIVLVPRSTIGKVNLWVDQFIRRNIPVGFGVNYNFYRDVNRR